MKRSSNLWGLIVLAAALAACRGAEQPGRHVVLILLDTARADRFGFHDPQRRTSPNLDALAARGAVFSNHFSQATATRPALPRMLYSRYFTPPLFPLSSRVPFSEPADLFRRLDSRAISLPAVLAAHGFHTAMISAHAWLKPNTAFAREFDEVHDLTRELEPEPPYPLPRAEAVVDYALDWLDRQRGRDVFLYLHLMDNHEPRLFGDDAAALFAGDADRWVGTVDDEVLTLGVAADERRAILDAIYDGSVRYADRHLGRLFERYREWGVLDDTLIAVTSDHGEHLLERSDRIGHEGPWFDHVARIPLVMSMPSAIEPRRIETASELIDVAPTLIALLGIELPRERSFDGVDLFSEAERERSAVFGSHAVRADGHKVIFDTTDDVLLGNDVPDQSRVRGRLYDLEVDPHELDDLWAERPEQVSRALELYRSRLLEPWRRYRETWGDRQPDSPFAIAAAHFETDRPVESAGGRSGPAARGEWVRAIEADDSFLQSLPGAQPISFELQLPSGRYDVSAALFGSCSMAIYDDTPRDLVAPTGGEPVSYGEVEVRDGRLRATLAPAGAAATSCSVSYLGFVPYGANSLDDEHEEALRALGYVN